MIASAARRHDFDPQAKPSLTQAYVTAARNARERFLARGELDFTDARILASACIKEPHMSARLSAALAARFREAIVDEAQDCNPADLEIIAWLRDAGIITKVICDPHQSIYEFRGGVTEQLFEFGKTFGDGQLPMSGNFRSSEHICKVIVSLRAKEARTPVDQALGKHRSEPTPVHILSYSGREVPASVGTTFARLVSDLKIDLAGCPVLAATRESAAKAVGQPIDSKTQNLTLRLAIAVTGFHFSLEMGNRKAALEEMHRVVLAIEGAMGPKTYHQYLAAEEITADAWRPRLIQLARDLRFEPEIYPNADAWLLQARKFLAPYVPADKGTVAQRLRSNAGLACALAIPSASWPTARTIHSVKGMQFPAVCVVMTSTKAKGILDFLENGGPSDYAENARKIYVAASRAQRLLVIAAPTKQASRLDTHMRAAGAEVTLYTI